MSRAKPIVTLGQAINELNRMKHYLFESYRGADGVVREGDVLHSLHCIDFALNVLNEKRYESMQKEAQ